MIGVPLCLPAAASGQADASLNANAATAVVYVFRDGGRRAQRAEGFFERLMGKHNVFVDDKAVAQLTRFSYVYFEVQPGWHLLWGGSDAEWFEFRSGQTYLVQIREGEGQTPNGAVGAWRLSPPWNIDERIAALGLERVEPTEESLAELRDELGGYERVRKRAGEAPPSTEVEIDKVYAVVGRDSPPSKRGVLSVTSTAFVYESDDVHLEVAKADFDSFGYWEEAPDSFGVLYLRDGKQQSAAFLASNSRDHNRALLAIQNLLAH